MAWIGAVVGLVGNAILSDSSKSSANKQSDAAKYAADMQWKMYDQNRTDQTPYREAGYGALSQLQQLLGLGGDPKAANYGSLTRQFTGANLQNDPGYQFGLNQGRDALQSSAAARGGLYSGATMKALERYGQDYGGTKFNEAFNRNQAYQDSLFNRLSGISGTGQVATQQVGQAGMNAATNAGNFGIQGANAQAAGQMYGANNLSNGFNQLAAWASNRNWGGGSSGGGGYRWDDPYSSPGYYGGAEGE
jgi:hypothetical protein